MLVLNRVEWENCFSYAADNSLNLSENNITQLIGENGAGKSSIALIIQEALYNKNSKSVKKAAIPNRELDTKHYWIKLYFTYQGKEYIVHINRKSSLKVNFLEDGADISSHTATETFKTIQKILGIDFKVFVQLMYQSVNDGLSFLTATDSNRKKFLIDLFGLDDYDKYHTVFKDMVKELNTSMSSIKGSLQSVQNWIDKNKNQPDPKVEKEVPDNPEFPENYFSLVQQTKEATSINRARNNNNQLKSLVKNISYDESIALEEPKSTTELTQSLGGFEQSVRQEKALIAKMERLGDKCPTCDQNIDQIIVSSIISESKEKISTALPVISDLKTQIEDIRDRNSTIQRHKKNKREYEDILVRIDHTLEEDLVDVEAVKKQIAEIDAEIQKAQREHKEIVAYNNSVSAHNERIAVISEQLVEHGEELESLQEDLDKAADRVAIAETLKKAFSTNGLVAHKLENLVKDIEQLTNAYLSELSDGRFTLFFTVTGDKLNVILTDNGAEIEISSLSSGELAKVNVATLLAIRKMMNSISKTQINILFLDEAINVLSESGRDCLIDVLLKEEGLNTFLVSHGWSHPLLAKVIIERGDDNISRLNYG